jgi:hypothetical protein
MRMRQRSSDEWRDGHRVNDIKPKVFLTASQLLRHEAVRISGQARTASFVASTSERSSSGLTGGRSASSLLCSSGGRVSKHGDGVATEKQTNNNSRHNQHVTYRQDARCRLECLRRMSEERGVADASIKRREADCKKNPLKDGSYERKLNTKHSARKTRTGVLDVSDLPCRLFVLCGRGLNLRVRVGNGRRRRRDARAAAQRAAEEAEEVFLQRA